MLQIGTSDNPSALGGKPSGGSKERESNSSSGRWPRMQSASLLISLEASGHGLSAASVTTFQDATNQARGVAVQHGHPHSSAVRLQSS